LPNQKIIHRFRIWSLGCAILGALFGLVALVGWSTGIDFLKGAFIGSIATMKTNAAIGLVLAGLGILLLWSERRGALRTLPGRLLGLIVAGIGLATLVEHLLHVDLGIDELLFREAAGAVGGANRMGLPGSVSFFLLGLALLLFDVRSRTGRAPYQYAALGVMILPILSLIGYLYQTPALYGTTALTGIAFPTSIPLLLLACAALLARPNAGFMRRLSGRDSGSLMARRLLPWAFLLPLAISSIRLLGEHTGFYDPDLGRAFLSFTYMAALTALIWWTAGVVSRAERAAESSRSEMQARLVQSLETMTDGFISCDARWRITYLNVAAERITGMKREDVVGSEFWSVFPESVGTDIERYYRRAMDERVAVKFETFYEPFQRYFESEVLPTADGGLALYGRDVTDRQHAMDVLQDNDRRKNRFLATLAHELRNPLAPVRNAVQLLRLKGNPEPDAAWAHAVIDRQVDHLTRLIEDLMDVSRISYGKLELRKERTTLSDVIAGAIESSRPAIESSRHQLVVRLPDTPLFLDADSVRLAQVFMNLLTNAAKYTKPGGTITLSAERQGSDVVVRVADTGVGLTPQQIPHLFEMFFQTEDVLKRTQGGLGIGLALVRHLVELHGGTVTASSDGPGRGSEFRVRLPLTLEPVREAPAPPAPATPSPPRLTNRRVLVVDDNRDATLSLVQLLELSGAQARLAFDGEEALALIDGNEFDVALLDIGLPKVSGHDLARAIRARGWGRQTVLIALTGWGQEGDRELSRDAGFDHHLVKPVRPDELLSLLAGEATARSPNG
jgi:PAS domain S-box-containing protein